ncbi:hypothetical protein QVD17_25132 [Tagetes erecta]|uniref:Uncharacterized protein n=1 Tax=Tagetes erecta TaxID=13708 RepID=A0AAD8KMA7_TARER|nr:hypothetical protein QVD17_25132 [Tagetes erecta]
MNHRTLNNSLFLEKSFAHSKATPKRLRIGLRCILLFFKQFSRKGYRTCNPPFPPRTRPMMYHRPRSADGCIDVKKMKKLEEGVFVDGVQNV